MHWAVALTNLASIDCNTSRWRSLRRGAGFAPTTETETVRTEAAVCVAAGRVCTTASDRVWYRSERSIDVGVLSSSLRRRSSATSIKCSDCDAMGTCSDLGDCAAGIHGRSSLPLLMQSTPISVRPWHRLAIIDVFIRQKSLDSQVAVKKCLEKFFKTFLSLLLACITTTSMNPENTRLHQSSGPMRNILECTKRYWSFTQ